MVGKQKRYSGWMHWWEWKEIFYFYDISGDFGRNTRHDRFVL